MLVLTLQLHSRCIISYFDAILCSVLVSKKIKKGQNTEAKTML